MLKLLFIFYCALIYICASVQASENLVEVFKWKQIEFATKNANTVHTVDSSSIVFPDMLDNIQHPKNFYANNKYNNNGNTNTENMIDYVAYNNVPMGVSHYKNKLFVTLPRRRTGIPATLNYIDLSSASLNSSPKFNPYPDYKYNELQSSQRNKKSDNSFISVYRTRVDYSCDRLWFIDTGMLEYPNNRTQVQQPSIWVFDLKTNEKIKRFEIPENVVSDGRGLASITVDSQPGNCDNAFAYIPDLYTYRLYVYSFRNDRIWTFQHNFFSFDPLSGDLDIADQKFQWNDGIFSITLGKRNPNGFRTAYFHPMVSTSEFSVSTEVLQDETRAERSYHGNDFKHLGNRGPHKQSTMHDCDPNTGIIMYAEIANYGVGCWNTNKMFSAQNHVTLQSNNKKMIYPSDLTIDSDGVMWMMTNSMPLFIYSSLNPNEYNFRIWKQNVHKATENTVCDANNNGNYLHTSSSYL